jgi:hypothetical protein
MMQMSIINANNRIGEWESFLPYNYATDLAETEEFIFVATELPF